MEVGLNLYSLYKVIQEEKDYLEKVEQVAKMGYTYAQFSGAPYNPSLIKKGIEISGIPIVLTHVPPFLLLGDELDKLIDEHLDFGCRNIGLGSMPEEFMYGKDGECDDKWKLGVEKLNAVAEKIEKAGAKFFYHHHFMEFYRLNSGETVFEYMVKNAPHINFILDSFWAVNGGWSTEKISELAKGKMDCVHLKDYCVTRVYDENGNGGYKPDFAPVGQGSLDFKSIIADWKKKGAKYFLVEQDNACDCSDPLGQVKTSVEYLKKI